MFVVVVVWLFFLLLSCLAHKEATVDIYTQLWPSLGSRHKIFHHVIGRRRVSSVRKKQSNGLSYSPWCKSCVRPEVCLQFGASSSFFLYLSGIMIKEVVWPIGNATSSMSPVKCLTFLPWKPLHQAQNAFLDWDAASYRLSDGIELWQRRIWQRRIWKRP